MIVAFRTNQDQHSRTTDSTKFSNDEFHSAIAGAAETSEASILTSDSSSSNEISRITFTAQDATGFTPSIDNRVSSGDSEYASSTNWPQNSTQQAITPLPP
ncbi:hypothetical protein G7Y89_g267 [Cudoniella acicularis]|uniref:Uncharacterized protein n=1 Tax=Cudoniella acicularis TaxID=354080 RepID=A0A8H4W833_9HELO|nr:hypothetical protein G7Y89_g267 [Cudoniella acicularis]